MTADQEEQIWKRRFNRLVEEGLHPDEAHELAAQMTLIRDKDGDDRRICLECTHYKDRFCHKIFFRGKPSQQLRFILQRCDHFKLRGAK
jgi:glutamate racemase